MKRDVSSVAPNSKCVPPVLDSEKFMLAEYCHLLQEMARYDNDSTKLSQLLGLMIFGTSFFSTSVNSQILFACLPFLSILAGFLLAANQYAYAAREVYVCEIERILAKINVMAPCFYSLHAKVFWHSPGLISKGFLPVQGAFFLIIFLLLGVVALSAWKTLEMTIHDQSWAGVYVAFVLAAIVYFFGSWWSSQRRLARLHIKLTDAARNF